MTSSKKPLADQPTTGWSRDQFLLVLMAVIVGAPLLGVLLLIVGQGMNVNARALTAAAPWVPAVLINERVGRSQWTRFQRLLLRLVLVVGGVAIAAAVLSRPATLP